MRNIIRKLFDTEIAPPLLFLIMVCLVGVTTGSMGDALSTWFKPWQIAVVGTIIIIIIIIIIMLVDPITKFINNSIRKRGTLTAKIGTTPEKHKGLIVFCSKGENLSAENAIRYHYRVLEQCWLITGGRDSEDAAKKLITKLVMDNFSHNLFVKIPMSNNDIDNPEKVFEVIEDIFKSLPKNFDESDVIGDYTGGTKSMTAGMILACSPPGRNLQFMKPNEYKEDGSADREKGSEPRFVDIRFKLKQK